MDTHRTVIIVTSAFVWKQNTQTSWQTHHTLIITSQNVNKCKYAFFLDIFSPQLYNSNKNMIDLDLDVKIILERYRDIFSLGQHTTICGT